MALDFFAGCIGGGAGVLVGYPLDTVKVKIQTQDPSHGVQYRGTFHCLGSIIREDGVRGLYRGMSSPLMGVAAINAITFGVYGNVLRCLDNPDSIQSVTLAGSAAGLVQTFIVSPMELVKTQMQVCGSPSISATIRSIFQQSGLTGLGRGLGITFTREVPAFGLYFGSYEIMIREYGESTMAVLSAGGMAGVLSWIFTYPQDVVKSRLQADGFGKSRVYNNAAHCVKVGMEREGHQFLSRGLVSTVIRAFPMNAATFYVYTWVMKTLGGTEDVSETYDTLQTMEKVPDTWSKRKQEKLLERMVEVSTEIPDIVIVEKQDAIAKWRLYPEQMLYACGSSGYSVNNRFSRDASLKYSDLTCDDVNIPTILPAVKDFSGTFREPEFSCARQECKCRMTIRMSDFLLPTNLLAYKRIERIYGFYYLIA